MVKLPGLIDPHVHLREPGGTHKEDWDSGTQAALAGGFTVVLAMPNTQPPVIDADSLALVEEVASTKARCDYGLFLGASLTPPNLAPLASRAAGLKMYLNHTFGPLKVEDMALWLYYFEQAPKDMPIATHSEGHTMGAIILMAQLFQRPVHLCHVSKKEEILLIRKAKEQGIPVTCEVAPHHLFLSEADLSRIGQGRGQVRPDLNTPDDQAALWENLDVIDCFATDHAPHTLTEKDSQNPPPGFPGLETALPLLLTATAEGRLTLDDIILRCHTNPRQIYHLPEQPETWVEIDPDARWEIRADKTFTRCGWTPFEGMPVQGRVERVVLRGQDAYRDGKILAQPGSGQNIKTIHR
jgi:carbamoyl-phosphate synthase/aspartate carbamoyltransferase/dihydroorotase